MKISDILKDAAEYYVSSFNYPDDPEGRKTNAKEKPKDDSAVDDDVRSKVFLPSHIQIEPGEQLDVVHDGSVLITDTWKNIKRWFKDNWNDLSGTYFLSSGGRVLHRIRTTSSDDSYS